MNDLHKLLGHPSETITRKTAKEMKVIVTEQFKPCEACALTKIRNKNLSKTPVKCSNIVGERLFLGVSSPLVTSLGGKCHWHLLVDDKSDTLGSSSLKEKSDLVATITLLKNWSQSMEWM